jgi:putative flippase GtrA
MPARYIKLNQSDTSQGAMMSIRQPSRPVVKRWLIFNSVGAMGIVVQFGTLFVLTSWAGLNYLLGTGLAVEAAVLHNFFWHARWTWADRIKAPGHFLRRFLGFHLANGALSIMGNLVLMRLFVSELGLDFMLSNAFAIMVCSLFNFFAGDRLVFREPSNLSKKGGINMVKKSCRTALRASLLVCVFLTAGLTKIHAADLQPEALKAWQAMVEKVERRISAELASNGDILTLDFQDPVTAKQERQQVLSGKVLVKQIGDNGHAVKVPNGIIHHWRGIVYIPGTTLDSVLFHVENPDLEESKQEDVLESRVMERRPGQLKLYLKLQRSKIVTVVYNTEHMVRYKRHGTGQASSSSSATKIAEIENHGERTEREKPEGRDHGYLWRMNSYWRYQEVKGGVIVECESITLSRAIPYLLEYVVSPLIKSVASESMKRTLESMRARMVDAKFEIRDSKLKASL